MHNPFRVVAALLAAFLVQAAAAEPSGRRAPEPAARIGINLNGTADWNSELPFVDVFRMARMWVSQREGAAWGQGPALDLDEHGWVRRLEPGCFAETPLNTIPGGRYPHGRYTVLHEGRGRITFSYGVRVVEEQPGRMVIDTTGLTSGFFLQIRETDPADPIRHIRVVMPGFEDTFARDPFHPAFLERWRGFAVLRFMDWMHTNNSPQRTWADRPTPESFSWSPRGVPVEVMVDLANRLGIDPWFCMPHLADDAYVRRFAREVAARLKPGLRAYVELSNEVWNGQFQQARWAGEEGVKAGFGPAERPWEAGWRYYAHRSVEVFRIWEEEFGGTERIVRVLAAQAANAWVTERILEFEDAGNHADALAIAPYIAFNLAPGSKPSSDEVAGWTPEQVAEHLATVSLPESLKWIREQKAAADRWGLRLIAYEAGQHAVGVGGGENNDRLTGVLQAAQRLPRMGEIYAAYLDGWRESGGDTAAFFSSVGTWSKWGSWGLMQHFDDQPADYPRFATVLRYAQAWGQPVAAP